MLLTPPHVKLDTDDDLELGVFGIATRLVRGERARRCAPAAAGGGRDDGLQAGRAARRAEPGESAAEEDAEPAAGTLTIGDQRHELSKPIVVLGRSKDCDIQVSDPNVSRRHAEVRRDGTTYTVVDLDSTNGIEVDGKRVKELVLEEGTRFTIGSTEIVFSRELA